LEQAMVHPSMGPAAGEGMGDNQRLEFLGDAVLQLVLTDELYRCYAAASEGLLTTARAQLVNRRTLAERARGLKLGEHLRLSRGEETSGGRQRASALADAYEALLGAIYLDGGLEAVRTVIRAQFRDVFGSLEMMPSLYNPKGELQERLQADSNEPPDYRLESVSGPEHDRRFECAVVHHGVELGRGTGRSKKDAESAAAAVALGRLLEKAASPHRAGCGGGGSVEPGTLDGGESVR
jgi:ribonuclease-3